MKKICATMLLFALLLALLSGCAGQQAETGETGAVTSAIPETAAPIEAPLTAEAHDWAEQDAVDDSYSFDYEWQVTCDCESGYEHLKKHELPEYIDRWVDGGELLDCFLQGIETGSRDIYYGWVCFSGMPKGETGWKTTQYQGKTAYCRSILIHGAYDDNGVEHCAVDKSIAMEPIEMLSEFEIGEDGEVRQLPFILPELESAELYVPQLGQSFLLTDPEALRGLEDAFSYREDVFKSMAADMTEQESFNPLYLHFADGGSALVLAAGDGANACLIWGLGDSFGPVSEFERFGVPLNSPGYTHNADGTVTIEIVQEGTDGSLGLAFRHEYRDTYDAQGRLILSEHEYHREDNEFDEGSRTGYFYREDGRIERIEAENHNRLNPHCVSTTTYEYNELGQKTRVSTSSPEGTMLGEVELKGFYYEYRYDEQNRLTARIYHYSDGREGMPSGNAYYWYDEAGEQHTYGVDEEGNLIGGPGEGGDNPVRR